MKAIIKNSKNNYTSYILAISNDKRFFDKKIIIFSPDYKTIKKINLYKKIKIRKSTGYHLHNNAFIFDYNSSDYIEHKLWNGLPCILQNEEILKKLEKSKVVDSSEIEELNQYAKEVAIPKFYEINTNEDLENLEMISICFHDATIVKAKTQDNNLFVTFDCMDCTINLQFIDIIEENMIGKVYQIYDSKFKIEDNSFKWDINEGLEGWINGTDCSIIKEVYLKCKKILWNFEFDFH